MEDSGALEIQVLGVSREAEAVRELVGRATSGDDPVTVLGEPGTGKQLIAQLIHERSPRAKSPFLMIDCSLYYERELKRELFGYGGEGAGQRSARKGILEFASRGTCYLAHVEELSPSIQATILEFLQRGRFCRLGDNHEVVSGARLIVSSGKNLEGFVRAGLFHAKLFEELTRAYVRLVPLRERKEDIPCIVDALRASFSDKKEAGDVVAFSAEVMEALKSYPWPLNFDELKKEVGWLLERGGKTVSPEHLSMEISSYWLGQLGDPETRRVLEELDGYIREFRVMSRLNHELGDLAGALAYGNESSTRNCYWDLLEEL